MQIWECEWYDCKVSLTKPVGTIQDVLLLCPFVVILPLNVLSFRLSGTWRSQCSAHEYLHLMAQVLNGFPSFLPAIKLMSNESLQLTAFWCTVDGLNQQKCFVLLKTRISVISIWVCCANVSLTPKNTHVRSTCWVACCSFSDYSHFSGSTWVFSDHVRFQWTGLCSSSWVIVHESERSEDWKKIIWRHWRSWMMMKHLVGCECLLFYIPEDTPTAYQVSLWGKREGRTSGFHLSIAKGDGC